MAQETIRGRAADILARRRSTAETEAARRREELYKSLPQLRIFDSEAAGLCRAMTAAVLEGDDARITQCRLDLDALQERRMAFLREAGIDEALLRPQYTCPLCRDTGFTEGRRCRCLEELLREEAIRSLPAGVLNTCPGFEGFDLTYYSDVAENGKTAPRTTMQNILRRCREYARSFSKDADNLLFIGKTGLGKTYLSVCIAREVLQQGCRVEYHPAQALIDRFERVRFSRSPAPEDVEATRQILTCDLLILDDLGAEFINNFSQSVLYQVINDRMVERRPTIISTNLDPAALSATYNERIVSRLLGSYKLYGFVGRDIRQQILIRKSREVQA